MGRIIDIWRSNVVFFECEIDKTDWDIWLEIRGRKEGQDYNFCGISGGIA